MVEATGQSEKIMPLPLDRVIMAATDEVSMWKKLEELYALYDAAIRAERTRYNALLENAGAAVKPEPSREEAAADAPDGR